ncbi:MAG TPA: TetR family transcriptional regulator, partial [Marinobacter hydrocarbonoclasticus]|nr:TetR family transcriptional regulator [Marinobacter nauticus]
NLSPLARIQAFVDDARAGMHRFGYRRGCLIGNLGQEMAALPESFRSL